MYYPTLDEVRQLKKHGNLVPVYYEMMADLETPVSAYLKIASDNYSFLLESMKKQKMHNKASILHTSPPSDLKILSCASSSAPPFIVNN